jgi:hypothetical protein
MSFICGTHIGFVDLAASVEILCYVQILGESEKSVFLQHIIYLNWKFHKASSSVYVPILFQQTDKYFLRQLSKNYWRIL